MTWASILHALPKELLPLTEIFARALLETGTDKEDYVKLSQRIGKNTGGIHGSTATATTLKSRESVLKLFLRGKATISAIRRAAEPSSRTSC